MDSFWFGLKHRGGYLCGMAKPLVHFVGFRPKRNWDRFAHALRIWGEPDFVHEAWDNYAENDTAPGDVIIFAEGEWDQEPRSFTVEAAMAKAARAAKKQAG